MNNDKNSSRPSVEWLATAATRIYAGRPEIRPQSAMKAAQDLWEMAVALANEAPDPWHLAFSNGDDFEQETDRLHRLGRFIWDAPTRSLEEVAYELQPPGSKKKAKAAIADLRKLATDTLSLPRELGFLKQHKAPELLRLSKGECFEISVSTARILFLARAHMIRTAKSRPKQRK